MGFHSDLKQKLLVLSDLGFNVRVLFGDRFTEINKWFSYWDQLSDEDANYLENRLMDLLNKANELVKERYQ